MPLNKVDRHIEEARDTLPQIARGPEGIIPPIRSLSLRWGVSPTTANRVMTALADRGYVTKDNRRNRYFLSPHQSEPPAPGKEYVGRIEVLEERLRDILETRASGKVPGIRRIMNILGCSYHTARKVLAGLEQQGWLTRNPKGHYRFPTFPRSATSLPLYVILYKRSHYDHFGSRFLGEMTRVLSNSGWGPLRYAYANEVRRRGLPTASEEASGYICLGLRRFIPRFPKLSSTPVVYVWQTTQSELPGRIIRERKGLHVTIDNRAAAIEIAGYLYATGNRHIGVFTHLPPSESDWVRERLEAFQGIFPRNSGERSMTIFTPEPRNRESLGENLNLWGRNWEVALPESLKKSDVGRYVPGEVTRMSLSNAVGELEDLCRIGRTMRPAFETALKNNRITAWVCINDDVAVCVAQFLRSRRKNGSKKSIISFDNTPRSAVLGISSYDFSPETMARVAVNGIMHPRHTGEKSRGIQSVSGQLIVRESSDVNV